jgi:hypothetical protein
MAQSFAPAVRIVERIDESRLVTLKGNMHPYANANNDRGRVSPTLPMTDLILVLSRSAEQQAAFDQFVASQYEPGSPNYHHWLEPEEVGDKFGSSLTDIATISNWLTGQGFSVDEVTKDRMSIRFSGTAGLVESAFHTEIHNLEVKGAAHIGNMSDPQIPAALAPAVMGVKALHNFFPRPQHQLGQQVTRNAKTGKWKRIENVTATGVKTESTANSAKALPQFGITVGSGSSAYLVEDVTPYDFATIYNVLPLWNASTPIDGTGQTVAIAGTSSIKQSDVTTFRTTFGLPTTATANTPKLISGNSISVTICSGTSTSVPYSGNYCNLDDQFENALDVEWSGAVAKGAQIVLVSSYPASSSDDGLYDSESYIINNKATLNASVMSVSYGLCELGMGTAGNAQYNTLWQTAAAEGIAVFVSTGDQGSAVCDAGMDSSVPYEAKYGLSVNGMASTPYNTAVGGTDLNWGSTASPYWSTSNASSGLSALSYMPEVPWNDTCTNPLALTYLENWATYVGVSGVTDAETACNFVVKYYYSIYKSYGTDLSSFVDITGGSGGASSCTTSNGSTVASCSGGYAKPSWQTGVTGIPSDGKRDLPDVSFFASNGFLGSAYLVCVSASGTCSYSTTSAPTAQEVGGTSASSPAMAGVMALINQKAGSAQGNPNSEFYTLAAKQTYANCTTESVTNSSSCYFNDIDTGTIAVPCTSGSPNCTVSHTGDAVGILSGWAATTGYDLATGLGSLNVYNVVNANVWVSIGSATATMSVVASPNPVTTVQSLTVAVTLTGSGGLGTPTGTVTLSGGGYTSVAQTLNSSGSYTFTIPAASLAIGADTLTVVYSGDVNYTSVTKNNTTVQVNGLTPVVHVTPSSSSLNSNVALSVAVTVSGSGPTPTGTVTLSGGGYSSGAQTLTSGSYTFTIPANTFSASGTVTLAALYSGDATYVSSSGSNTVTVTFVLVLTPTVTVTPASSSVNSNASLNVTAKVAGTGATPTGTVMLSGGGLSPTLTGTLSSGSYTFTVPANSLNAGTDTLTVNYSGDANYYAGAQTANVTVTQSTFTLAASAPAAIASPGGQTTSTVTVTAVAGYSGTAALSCTPTSTGTYAPTCSITSTPLSMGGTATATVFTTATAELVYPKMPGKGRGWAGAGGGAVLAFLVFLGIPARRRSWRSMLGVLVLMAALGSLAACGGGGGGGGGGNTSTTGTPLGTYTFTVIGVGSPSVSPVPSTTFTVTVN